MELLRRGGFAYMQTWRNNAAEPIKVKWYRAAPGAKVYTGFTPFRSSFYGSPNTANVEDDCCGRANELNSGLGMQSPFEYDACGCPVWYPFADDQAPAWYTGLQKCGSDEVWRDGGRFGVDEEFLTDAEGRVECCPLPWFLLDGGDVEGGDVAFQGDRTIGIFGGEIEGGEVMICEAVPGCRYHLAGGEVEGGEDPFVPFLITTGSTGSGPGTPALIIDLSAAEVGDLIVIAVNTWISGGEISAPAGLTPLSASADTEFSSASKCRYFYRVLDGTESGVWSFPMIPPASVRYGVLAAVYRGAGIPTIGVLATAPGVSLLAIPGAAAPHGSVALVSWWGTSTGAGPSAPAGWDVVMHGFLAGTVAAAFWTQAQSGDGVVPDVDVTTPANAFHNGVMIVIPPN